jgi:hypothetical protein
LHAAEVAIAQLIAVALVTILFLIAPLTLPGHSLQRPQNSMIASAAPMYDFSHDLLKGAA